jgi:hypothetical protein
MEFDCPLTEPAHGSGNEWISHRREPESQRLWTGPVAQTTGFVIECIERRGGATRLAAGAQ